MIPRQSGWRVSYWPAVILAKPGGPWFLCAAEGSNTMVPVATGWPRKVTDPERSYCETPLPQPTAAEATVNSNAP